MKKYKNIKIGLNNYIFNQRMKKNRAILGCGPPVLQVEITTKCPNNCRFCAKRVMEKEDKDASLLTLYLAEKLAKTARLVILGGWGEPLSGKMLFPILKRVNQGAFIRLITSGMGINPDKTRKLAKYGLNEAVISLDHHDNKGMQRLRGIEFDQALSALETFAPIMKVRIAMTLANSNMDSILPIMDIAEKYNAPLDISAIKIYDPLLADENIYLDPKRTGYYFALARKKAKEKNIALTLPPLGREEKCFQPFETMFLRADGSIYGCCSAIFAGQKWGLQILSKKFWENNNGAEISFEEILEGKNSFESNSKMLLGKNKPLKSIFLKSLPLKKMYANISEDLRSVLKNPRKIFDNPIYQHYRLAHMGLAPYPLPCQNCAWRFPSISAYNRFIEKSKPKGGEGQTGIKNKKEIGKV